MREGRPGQVMKCHTNRDLGQQQPLRKPSHTTLCRAPCPPTHLTDLEPTVYMQRFLSSAGRIVYASGEPPLEEPPGEYGEGWVTMGPQQPYKAAK